MAASSQAKCHARQCPLPGYSQRLSLAGVGTEKPGPTEELVVRENLSGLLYVTATPPCEPSSAPATLTLMPLL
eukprot:4408225-Pleurochrysis_carterae.AAC.1